MKILVNGINHSPEMTGIGKYTGEMVKWLTQKGYEVKVVTAPPYYPQWKICENYKAYLYLKEKIDNVDVIRCPLWVPGQPTGLKRIIHLASFAIMALPVMIWQGLVWRPDVVMVIEPTFFCAPGALVSGWLAGSKKWLHIQDFEIDAAFDLGILRSGMLRDLIVRVESVIMRRFDTVSTISVKMLERLHEKGVDDNSVLLFENWVETDKIYPLRLKPPIRDELQIPENKYVLLYSGNMGNKQGLELLIGVAKRLQTRADLLFVLCGEGSSKEQLKNMAVGMTNVMFLPLQPVERLNELLNLADIHLLPQQSGVEDLVMPSKLTNMMASGKPVIATACSGTQVHKVVSKCGVVVESMNVKEFCRAIEKLIENRDLATKLGDQGREYAEENWDKDKILESVFNDSGMA